MALRVPRGPLLVLLTVAFALLALACSTPPPSDDSSEGTVVSQEPIESGETIDSPSPDPSDPSDPIPSDGIYPSPESAGTPKVEGGAPRDTGRFLVEYRPPSTPAYAEVQKVLQNSQVLEHVAAGLNAELALPRDLTLSAEQCGMVNAFYDPRVKRLILCYELVNHFAEMYQHIEGQSEDEFVSGVFSAMVLVLYHEIGHALVDVFDIKTPGRPEDVVDQLAVFMLLKKGEEQGARMAMRGARYFALSARERGSAEIAFWDEHSTDETRFFNIYCWIYGSDKDKYSSFVDSGILPPQRAARCTDEYTQLSEGWNRLLQPHMR